MPHSPRTPYRRRPSSSLDLSLASTSPQGSPFTPIRPSRSRKSSIQSIQSLRTPTTPRPQSSNGRPGDFNFSNDHGGAMDAGNGLGSLADELAEAWDEDEEVEEGVSEIRAEEARPCNGHVREVATPQYEFHHDMGFVGLAASPILHQKPNGSLSPPKQPPRSKQRRKDIEYDGSDYGDNSDLEECGITPLLETRMAVIESLARQGTALNSDIAHSVFTRVCESLRELSSQASAESHTTRLSTAHNALTSHLTHQTRVLQTLTHPLLSPLSVPPSAQTIDILLPLLSSLVLSLPQPPTNPLPALHALYVSSTDLGSTLSYLSDTLHMMRQTTTLASRRLRTAREAVGTMRREMDEAEEGVRWLETGGWEAKLRNREAAKVCREVVGGFEEVCNSWRDRLMRQGEGVEVGAG